MCMNRLQRSVWFLCLTKSSPYCIGTQYPFLAIWSYVILLFEFCIKFSFSAIKCNAMDDKWLFAQTWIVTLNARARSSICDDIYFRLLPHTMFVSSLFFRSVSQLDQSLISAIYWFWLLVFDWILLWIHKRVSMCTHFYLLDEIWKSMQKWWAS